MSDATKRVLNLQLKELEEHGVISKRIFHELPLRVEYSLTPLGESLMPIIDAMNHWGDAHRPFLESVMMQGESESVMAEKKSACAYYLDKVGVE
jgi:DNA-binding HxlR family transcriptional regulator